MALLIRQKTAKWRIVVLECATPQPVQASIWTAVNPALPAVGNKADGGTDLAVKIAVKIVKIGQTSKEH
ncbi:MAG: hypothetical protein LBO67_10115 [Spirochaetaceae bacterium]|nr:hypothetical protein [Spirochaetaceae bacterium]